MSSMKFTSHNILLNNGEKTKGDNEILLSDSAVWKSIENTVNLFMPGTRESRKKLRVVDLGCLEGGYAVEFARLGFDTLGIEARDENVAKCNYVKDSLNLSNLQFVKDDVRNIKKYGKFDIVLCYGLLYHLNDPVAFLKQVGECTSGIMLLNTHFAPMHDLRYSFGLLNSYFIGPIQRKTGLLNYTRNWKLSRLTYNEGYRGRWYKEWSKKWSKDKVEKSLWASYNNERSFWLCKKDLTMALHAANFDSVFEQFNYTGDLTPHDFPLYHSRSMFVAIKDNSVMNRSK
jgi:SAM-dependent methyltransferase